MPEIEGSYTLEACSVEDSSKCASAAIDVKACIGNVQFADAV
ncbi:MAG: hypothetical protein R2880_11670 [Deinococcales bacterium]